MLYREMTTTKIRTVHRPQESGRNAVQLEVPVANFEVVECLAWRGHEEEAVQRLLGVRGCLGRRRQLRADLLDLLDRVQVRRHQLEH